MATKCIYGLSGNANERVCWEEPDFAPPPGFPDDWFGYPAPRGPTPPVQPRVPPRRTTTQIGDLVQLAALGAGGPSVADRPPSRPQPRIPTAADFPFVFGGAAPAQPAPARRPRPARRRTRRPARRGRPVRTTPRPAVPGTVVPESPPPPAPETAPVKRPPPATRPWRIPIPTSVPGALIDIWRGLLDEYLRPRRSPTPGGGPRRGGRRSPGASPDVVVPPAPVPSPTATPGSPARRSEPVVEPFPSRNPGPGYDPFTWTWPQPPATTRQPATRTRSRTSTRVVGNRGPAPRQPPRRRDPMGRNPPRDTPRRTPPGDGFLTQLNPLANPLTSLQPGTLKSTNREPSSDPCAVRARNARRRQRQQRKECKSWTYKVVKVCRSSNAKYQLPRVL